MLHAGIEDLTYNFTNRCFMFYVFVQVKLVVLGKMTSSIEKIYFSRNLVVVVIISITLEL